MAALPEADVAIVLGGAVGQPTAPRVSADLSEAGDRVLEAARLFRAGKVRHIVVAAGNLPAAATPEAVLIADLLVEFGVPREALVLETESRNTYENAVNTAELLRAQRWHTALLVTSGAHMPRALATCKRAGIDVPPAPTAPEPAPRYPGYLRFIYPTTW